MVALGIAILFLILLYRSRAMFQMRADRCFVRMPEGLLLYYPRMVGTGYVVPDVDRELALRQFAKWLYLSPLFVLPFVILPPIVGRIITVVAYSAIYWSAVRIATKGLVKAAEKRRIPWLERFRESARDASPGFQWVRILVLLLFFATVIWLNLCGTSRTDRALGLSGIFLFGVLLWGYSWALWTQHSETTDPSAATPISK